MIYLMMRDQTYRQVPEAERAAVIGDQVVCFGSSGTALATFPAATVTAFGSNPALKEPEASNVGSVNSRRKLIDNFCRHTEEAHASVLSAAYALERSLVASPRTASLRDWRASTDKEVRVLMDCLRMHCRESESYGGLIAQMNALQGHSEYLTRLKHSHEKVLATAQLLLQDLGAALPATTPSRWLRELGELSSAVHEHEASEIDVIYETFWRDPVGGD